MIIPIDKEIRIRGTAEYWQLERAVVQKGSINDAAFDWLRRIESILRNGLPTNDKAEASTIAHAHSEVEKALEDISHDWWMQ